jgi:hypothetical protein
MQPSSSPRVLETPEPVIETARPADIPRLVDFTSKRTMLPSQQWERLPVGHASWQTLIKAHDLVCATAFDGTIAGYYAINQFSLVSEPSQLHELQSAHNVLCNRFRLSHSDVSFGAQVVIHPAWQLTDLRIHLLRALLRTVGLRFRYLFTEVRKNNADEMLILPREGWHCFHEEDEVCYMMLNVAKALRQLASRLLLLRLPNRPESSLPQATHA